MITSKREATNAALICTASEEDFAVWQYCHVPNYKVVFKMGDNPAVRSKIGIKIAILVVTSHGKCISVHVIVVLMSPTISGGDDFSIRLHGYRKSIARE